MKSNTITLIGQQIPKSLRNIHTPPKTLYARGELQALNSRPMLAVVGSRKITPYGREVTQRLVQDVVNKGVSIVSGLALGLDGVAHQATLEANGTAIAVMPAGLDEIYPRTHSHLGMKILESGGVLIGEYPDGVSPKLHHFVKRNRLVAGLVDAVLIVEASAKSGSMITANFALEQGKTVMAVPGNITSPASHGTNNLIKTGALAVTDANDILLALGIDSTVRQIELFGDNPEETLLLQLLVGGTTDIHELQKASKLPTSKFNQTLTMLEINGKIRSQGGGHWTLR